MVTARGRAQQESLTELAALIDRFEGYQQMHSRFMAELAARLGRRFGLSRIDINSIAEAALLHDIGLYTMAPGYCAAPRPLSFENRMDLRRHPIIGEQQAARRGASRHAQLLVRWHHEWWNGSGYPDGLAFEDIPIGARIIRAVDTYSALISNRPYRLALSYPDALRELQESAGLECDPYVVSALAALLEESRTRDVEAAHALPIEAQPPRPVEESISLAVPRLYPVEQPDSAHNQPSSTGVESPSSTVVESGGTNHNSNSVSESGEPRRNQKWLDWKRTSGNRKPLLGFEAGVLRQLEFRSIAIPFCGWTGLDEYLNTWGKVVFANDPRAWAVLASRAVIEAAQPLADEMLDDLLAELYAPGTGLSVPELRNWFVESDAWWMDNLRQRVDTLEDELTRAQMMLVGMMTGDYIQSFEPGERGLRMPLPAVFRRLAHALGQHRRGHPASQSFNLPADEFIRRIRADVLYLTLPTFPFEEVGSEARSRWREVWVTAGNAESNGIQELTLAPQSRRAYLQSVERLLAAGSHLPTWMVGFQDLDAALARDIIDLIRERRQVRTTYSKDLTEMSGGTRCYISVAATG